MDISVPKGEMGEMEGAMGPKKVRKLLRQIPLDLDSWVIHFGLMLCPEDPPLSLCLVGVGVSLKATELVAW